MIRYALAGTAAWLLDLVSAHPSIEANPLVNALGSSAPFAKLAVLGFALLAAALLSRVRPRLAWAVLSSLLLVGCVGALSNVAALR